MIYPDNESLHLISFLIFFRHNSVRGRHGANDLTWSQELVNAAQSWAERCQFKHSGGAVGSFGENLAAGTGKNYQLEDGIKQWADEVKDYNPNSPQFSHFTQMVWKASTQVGCVQIRCPSLDLGGGNKWDVSYIYVTIRSEINH